MPLSIGNLYHDQIVCDVLEMDVCHVLLGQPWQQSHSQWSGQYIQILGKKVILLPLDKQTTLSKVPSSKKQLFLLSQGKDLFYSKEQPLLAFVVKQDPIESPNKEMLDRHISNLLKEFPSLLEEPNILPLLRNIQHHRLDAR